ncbi:MAG: hypothetical protein HZB56_16885 [Deltaproteobacteria bacterium]|nr:hypothetical protein [Deltaproteobacteria bacterium]
MSGGGLAGSPGPRALSIAARTAHLLATAVFLGGTWLAAGDPALRAWWLLSAGSGAVLLLTEASHSRHWVYQGRGLATLLHVALLGLLAVEGAGRAATAAALIVGAVGSHLPRSLRKWSFRHRRVVE